MVTFFAVLISCSYCVVGGGRWLERVSQLAQYSISLVYGYSTLHPHIASIAVPMLGITGVDT